MDNLVLQITTSLMDHTGMKNHTLMLADTESEKTKWVVALSELHRILKRNNLPNRTVSVLCHYLCAWEYSSKSLF
jgi:serine/threonine-protein kinase MRCK